MQRHIHNNSIIVFLLMIFMAPVYGQEAKQDSVKAAPSANDAAELAKKLSNPISSLISLPFQNNAEFRIGPDNGSKNVTNIQPVIPVKLAKNLNLINRFILPVIAQQHIFGNTRQAGLGDAVLSNWLSPTNTKHGITWGVGPVFLLPTATNKLLGSTKFGLGPTAIFLAQSKGFTIGALVNQIWSVAGYDDTRNNISIFYVQPFFSYNWKSGAGIGISGEITQDWKNKSTVGYLCPNVSGITKFGKQTVSLSIGPKFGFSTNSDPFFGIRSNITFVFPK
jgi:hypothetical protein